MKCWICGKEGADADTSIPDWKGVPYHTSCAKCPKCGSEEIAWKLFRQYAVFFRCQECLWASLLDGNEQKKGNVVWIPIYDEGKLWKEQDLERQKAEGKDDVLV